MASSHGSAGDQFTGLKPYPTKKEKKRKKFKALLGVCRIKVLERGVGYRTVSSGCIIKGLHEQALLKNKCCLVTSDKVLPTENFHIDEFYMDFRKLNPEKIKTVKLSSIADGKASIERATSGMVAIILKEYNVFGDTQSFQSVVTYRPFSKELNDDGSSDFFCQVVDDKGEKFFDVKSFTLKRTEREFILCDGQMEYRSLTGLVGNSNLKPYGAAILTRGENPKAVGILNFSDDEKKTILPILLPGSQIRYLEKTPDTSSKRERTDGDKQTKSVQDFPKFITILRGTAGDKPYRAQKNWGKILEFLMGYKFLLRYLPILGMPETCRHSAVILRKTAEGDKCLTIFSGKHAILNTSFACLIF